MDRLDLFRRAVTELGDVSASELCAHIEKKHGVKIEPAYIPLYKACLRDLERTNELRQDAKGMSEAT
jgi:hypothetical protein